MTDALSPAERQALKARAHALAPVAMIGKQGLTPDVLAEIDRQLTTHEIIKVKTLSDERGEREAWLVAACEALGAAAVQHVGKVLVMYRKRVEPAAKAKPAEKPQRPADRPTPQEYRQAAAAGKPPPKRDRRRRG